MRSWPAIGLTALDQTLDAAGLAAWVERRGERVASRPRPRHRRTNGTPVTWAAFGALFGFGILNAVLGPVLPFLRAELDLGYFTASLHQVAFALGGGTAGLVAASGRSHLSRRTTVVAGWSGAGLAGLGIGFGPNAVVTVAAAYVASLCATSALIAVWAMLADVHAGHRAVAMTEGEVAVSLAGVARRCWSPAWPPRRSAGARRSSAAAAVALAGGRGHAGRRDARARRAHGEHDGGPRRLPPDPGHDLRGRGPGVRAELLARQLPRRRGAVVVRIRGRHRGRCCTPPTWSAGSSRAASLGAGRLGS